MQTIHKAAAMVIQDNTFLMVRKVGSDLWTSLGGHIEAGETETEALIREVKEELDCTAVVVRKLDDFVARAATDDAELILSTYLVTLSGRPHIADPELEEFRFISEADVASGIKLPASITEGVLPYCISHGLLTWAAMPPVRAE